MVGECQDSSRGTALGLSEIIIAYYRHEDSRLLCTVTSIGQCISENIRVARKMRAYPDEKPLTNT